MFVLFTGRGPFGCHPRVWQWNYSSCCPSREYPRGFKKLLQSVATSSLLRLPPAPWYFYSCILAFISFSVEIKASLQHLEPAFENLPRTANVHEDVINALRMEEILDREMFVSLDSTEEGLAKSAKEAFGVGADKKFRSQEGVGETEESLEPSQTAVGGQTKSGRRCPCARRAYYDAGLRLSVIDDPIQAEVRLAHS